MGPGSLPRVSIVIPVYGGAKTVGRLVDELFATLAKTADLEVVLVNDCSPDDSERVCLEIARRHGARVLYAAMARNFGEHNAVLQGLRLATGDFVVTMDDDGQNPPSEVAKLLAEARRGIDAVFGDYQEKRHDWFRNLGSAFNDRVANWLIGKPKDLYLSSFRCLTRFVVDEIVKYTGPYPYIDGLVLRTTASISSVPVIHDRRLAGRSRYTLAKLVGLWLNMSTNFSVAPLRIAVVTGFLMASLGGLMAIEVVVEKWLHPATSVGWSSLMTAITVFSGVQLILIGTIGEYVGRLLLSVNATPQAVVRRVVRGGEGAAPELAIEDPPRPQTGTP
ncbi:MAG: glycosyltransferase family 2 protein [Candidatus Binatia bacterium]